MKMILIPLSIAALTVVAMSAGAVQKPVQIADQRLDFPTNAQENDVHFRDVADLTIEYEYPSPEGDGNSPEIRFPGVPAA